MSGTCWPEKLSTNRQKMIKELVQGHEFATQLQILLQKPYGGHGCLLSSSPDELVVKILRSFTETLSVLSSCESGVEVCQNLSSSQVDSACCDDRKSEDSGESRERPATKDRRGCYKRKKISQSWTTVSPTIEDGHAWRKYGQKEILNSKHPRSYFRCTRKSDQGCKAIKQVQRMEENPQMYHTTYIGNHTCKDILNAPQIITDSDPWESYYILCSNSKIPPNHELQDHPISSSTTITTPTIKQESKEETPSDVTDNVSSLDSIMWKDIMAFDSADDPTLMKSDFGSVVYPCTEATSHQSLDMDFAESIDFECDFHFDESKFMQAS